HESGVANTADPLGGSYFVERLTLATERACYEYFDRIDALGGMVAAIEKGFPQKEIHDAAYAYQKAVDRKEEIIVGVNDFVTDEELERGLELHERRLARIEENLIEQQAELLNRVDQRLDRVTLLIQLGVPPALPGWQ